MSTCISFLLCIVEFTTLTFGILPLRDGILEGRNVTDPETLPVPLPFSLLVRVFRICGGGLEDLGEVQRGEEVWFLSWQYPTENTVAELDVFLL